MFMNSGNCIVGMIAAMTPIKTSILWLLQRLMAQLMGIIGVMAGLDNKMKSKISLMGHVNEYPTMHCFGIPRHTRSMIAYKILTEYFWKFQAKISLWECC